MAKLLHRYINSPWLLLAVPLLIGGFWLVLNPWVITNNINKPYALLAGPALAVSFLGVWLVIKFFGAITALGKAIMRARKENGAALFFWITITVFMAVSVIESGEFFNTIIHSSVPLLGYATALVIDLVTVTIMNARLEAVRMHNKARGWFYLFLVAFCASVSAYANLYSGLNNFAHTPAGSLPSWMNSVAPWLSCLFPALIILMSIAADDTLDRTSTRLDANKYRDQEEKRLAVLRVRRDMERDRLAIERDLAQIAVDRKGPKHQDREWFWFTLLRPVKPASVQVVTDEVMKTVGAQLGLISGELKALKSQQAEYTVSKQQMASLIQSTIEEQLSNALSEVEEMTVAHVASDEEQEAMLSDDSNGNMSIHSTLTMSDNSTEQSLDTDAIEVVNKRIRKPASKTKKMHAILKRNPDISAAELATKTDVTVQYAYRVKDTYLKKFQAGELNTVHQNGHNGHQSDEVTLSEYTPA
ncbi:MAG: hypothetical protein E6J34_24050 [Chloroflexi bacterium]|nr:MAG: hypothetical protein E6J34_24050 [Chloroflexota bacterium]